MENIFIYSMYLCLMESLYLQNGNSLSIYFISKYIYIQRKRLRMTSKQKTEEK